MSLSDSKLKWVQFSVALALSRKLSTALAAAFVLALSVPAEAVTFDLSTLNVNAGLGSAQHPYTCPCTDPITGTTIFSNASNSQSNGWTMGTDGGAATLYFAGNGRGNNAGKIYDPSGAPIFPLPPGQSLGNHNTQGTGDFAQADGFPLYFWFGSPGSTSTTPASGVAVQLDSFYISGGTGSVTVTGYSDLGVTPIDSTVISAGALQQITLDWSGIEQLSFTGNNFFYINDIEVNDIAAVPAPIVLPGLLASTGLLLWWRRRQGLMRK